MSLPFATELYSKVCIGKSVKRQKRYERSSRLIRNLSNLKKITAVTCSQQLWLIVVCSQLLKLRSTAKIFHKAWHDGPTKIDLLPTVMASYNRGTNPVTCCITLSSMMDPLKLTCSQQLWLHRSWLEHCTGIAEVTGSNPAEA